MKELKPVLYIESDEKSLNCKFREGFDKCKGGVMVCSIDYDVPELIEENVLPGNVQIGDVFVRSPYDDKYIAIKDYEITTMQDKASHIAEVARLLGASSCQQEIEVEDVVGRKYEGTLDAGYKPVKITAEMKKEVENKTKKSIRVVSTYSQAKVPTVTDYERAREYARQHCLLLDSSVDSLLKARNPNETNLMSEREIVVNLSSESNTNLDIAAKLSVMQNVFELNSTFHESTKIQKNVRMILHYTFAMPSEG